MSQNRKPQSKRPQSGKPQIKATREGAGGGPAGVAAGVADVAGEALDQVLTVMGDVAGILHRLKAMQAILRPLTTGDAADVTAIRAEEVRPAECVLADTVEKVEDLAERLRVLQSQAVAAAWSSAVQMLVGKFGGDVAKFIERLHTSTFEGIAEAVEVAENLLTLDGVRRIEARGYVERLRAMSSGGPMVRLA